MKINYHKSEALNISLQTKDLSIIQQNCPFKWETKDIKYQGVRITRDLNKLFEQNFPPLLPTTDQNPKFMVS